MLILNVKVKSTDDEITKEPAIVNVCILSSSILPLNVTVKVAGITMEQLPDGTCPPHVAASLKSPDWAHVNVPPDTTVVTVPVFVVVAPDCPV